MRQHIRRKILLRKTKQSATKWRSLNPCKNIICSIQHVPYKLERYFELGTFRKHPNVRTKSTQLERDNYYLTGYSERVLRRRVYRTTTSANKTVYKNVTKHTSRKLLRRPERSPAGHDTLANFFPASRLLRPVTVVWIVCIKQAGSSLHLRNNGTTFNPVPIFRSDHG